MLQLKVKQVWHTTASKKLLNKHSCEEKNLSSLQANELRPFVIILGMFEIPFGAGRSPTWKIGYFEQIVNDRDPISIFPK